MERILAQAKATHHVAGFRDQSIPVLRNGFPCPGNSAPKNKIYSKSTCACGGGCPRCQAKSNLKISQPNDLAEIEADQIADRIIRMPADKAAPVIGGSLKNGFGEDGTLQRKALSSPGGIPSDTPPHVQSAIGSGGRPLEQQPRSFFEARLGFDLSGIRIHTESTAEQSARAINARAYTLGHNIIFWRGEYKPNTESGVRLLAHELTHMIQQVAGVGDTASLTQIKIQRKDLPRALDGVACDIPGSLPIGEMENLLFDVGESDISYAEMATLNDFVDNWWTAGTNYRVRIDGYASNPGGEESNWQLSCSRAQSVASGLMYPSDNSLGIPEDKIEVYAHGKTSEFGVDAQNQRVGISWIDPSTSTPNPPIQTPAIVDQARTDAAAALRKTAKRIEFAIDERNDSKLLPEDVAEALARFFPGTSHVFLEQLLARIKPMAGWIKSIPVQLIVPTKYDYMEDTYTFLPGTTHTSFHEQVLRDGVPAAALASPEKPPPNYIALYEVWKNTRDQRLRAAILLHEAYHFSFPFCRGHDKTNPWNNPFAYEGFVSILGGLALGPIVDKQYQDPQQCPLP